METKSIKNLEELLKEIFLITSDQFSWTIRKVDLETWDSLGLTSLAVGIHEEFNYHFEPSEALELNSFEEIKRILLDKGVISE